ncbi:hypothetical protein [Bradyrhizobium zhanjiangense]|uniref:Uncharacterized protein n=1 Tax=Bradyrhizobium zhanjiangense TaxID=1325107 RepID=A0A4V1L3Y9_9BRAD|nr:hypothetical protein [Bradyrhizobium zhanjiangense]RXH39634.1 hypothetical protein XH94_17225 [Bradyrhizobium zhanjiangense]
MTLSADDWVEVRSKEEILATLDTNGRLEEMPFMPQMFQYCGKRFKVYKRAHKTCDTVNPVAGRRVPDAVHLSLRCNGKAYGGCQAACLLFWKEAWLKPIKESATSAIPRSEDVRNDHAVAVSGCSEEDVLRATHVQRPGEPTIYRCQATQLPDFTAPLAWWDVRQYVEDYTSGNAGLGRIFAGFAYLGWYHFALAKRRRLGRPMRWLYDQFQKLVGGLPYPRKLGTIPYGQRTPIADLNLQPGELVRVKSYDEILATLEGSRNRGMFFDAELVPYCGGTYRVLDRVSTFIDEKTGILTTMKTPAVILEGAWCQSRFSNCRMFCPRAIYCWWREVWLERVAEPPAAIASRRDVSSQSDGTKTLEGA